MTVDGGILPTTNFGAAENDDVAAVRRATMISRRIGSSRPRNLRRVLVWPAILCLAAMQFRSAVRLFGPSSAVGFDAVAHTPRRRPRRKVHIVLVKNRNLEADKSYGYYTFAMWRLYTHVRPECTLLAYNSSPVCGGGGGTMCAGYRGARVAPYWTKVLAVRAAMDVAGEDDLVAFFDTDAQILNANFTKSLLELDELRAFLHSGKTMLVIDEREERTSFWNGRIRERGIYSAPITSNQFVVINNDMGRRMMDIWWQSMNHPTPWDASGKEMHSKWPWEQERLAAYYNATPDLFYPVQQTWTYFGFNHHGPLCCVGFGAKHDIIRSLNVTLTNQTRALPELARWNGTAYEELASDLFHEIHVRPLAGRDGMRDASNEGFWRVWESAG